MTCKKSLLSLLMLGMLTVAAPAFAEETITVGAGLYAGLNGHGVTSVAVADPSVADVIVSNGEVILVGKKAGGTSMFVWRYGNREQYTLVVQGNNTASAAMIKAAIGYDSIDVTAAGNKIILEGSVANQYERLRAEKIASSYGEVVNLLEMEIPRQVRIECRILDISKSNTKNIGINIGSNSDTSSSSDNDVSHGMFSLGQGYNNSRDRHHGGNPLHWFGSYADINARVSLLVNNGNAKILSQPYIITMSGEKADVFIGGQIPIPVSDDGDVTTEWKDYGIKLQIEPVVQNNGAIDSKITTEVSSLDEATAITQNGFSIPGIITRTANTHVMMKPGMTMAIGGLISSEQSKSVNKIPLLGDIPILGQFFRSTSKKKSQREIVILITPMVVDDDYKPVMSEEMRRISKLKDEEVIRGDLHVEPKKKKR